MTGTGPTTADEAVRRAHEWFEHNSGWAPPDDETLDEWVADGVCRCPDECLVTPRAWCEHGLASWWLILRALREAEILAHLSVDRRALLGEGGEARVFALDAERVLRVPHGRVPDDVLDARRDLLAAVAGRAVVALPEVLEHRSVGGHTVVIERRLPGSSAVEVLGQAGTDRASLVRHHLEVAASIADLPCPTDRFGGIWGGRTADSFEQWATDRLSSSLARAGSRWAHLDPAALTEDLLAALPQPEPASPPVLVHLDAHLGNMLAEGDRITALLDFGPTIIGGLRHLDPLAAIAYLAPEITPPATPADVAVARAWADEHGLTHAIEPVERWLAAYWTFARDDIVLQGWCARVLLPRHGC